MDKGKKVSNADPDDGEALDDELDPSLAATMPPDETQPPPGWEEDPSLATTLPPESLAASADGAKSTDADAERLTHEAPGRYETKSTLGAGGIGQVNLAYDSHLERNVAIKELLPVFRLGSTSAKPTEHGRRSALELRFLKEARITGRLEHPGIVPVYELGKRDDGSIYYSMKVVRGASLADAMRAKRGLAERLSLLPAYVDVCNALAYAHHRGVIHRDLKPDNVMTGPFGETLVLDWGLAKVHGDKHVESRVLADEIEALKDAAGGHTIAGSPLGTPAYMSPEQARGDLEAIDERSDVYSLGVMLFELVTGRLPFIGKNAIELMEQHKDALPPSPSELEPDCPAELAAIISRALDKDRERRYADAEALADDLRAFQTGGLVGAHRYTIWALLRRWLRRNWKPLVAAAVVLVVGSGVWWYRGYAEAQRRAVHERARQAAVLKQVEDILGRAIKGGDGKRWFEIFTYKLISLREPVVETRLVKALKHENAEVRRLAALALGGMRSRQSVPALVARLEQGVEKAPRVLIEVINALGVIGDPSADRAVQKTRWRYGQHGYVWKNTTLAYRMIPMRPLVNGGRGLSADQWTDRGRGLENKGKRKEAIAVYNRALALNPRFGRALVNRANARKSQGDFEGALRDYTAALEVDSKKMDHASRYNRALLLRRLGQYNLALSEMSFVIAKSPKLRRMAYRARAVIHQARGALDDALIDLKKAVALDPRSSFGHRLLGGLWWEKGDLPRALAAYDRALALSPRYVWGLHGRARIHWLNKNRQAALGDLDRAIGIDPDNASCRLLRAILRHEANDAGGARRDIAQARRRARKDQAPLMWAASAVFGDLPGSPAAAAKSMARAIALAKPDERSGYRTYAVALALLRGQLPAARRELKKVAARKHTRAWRRRLVAILRGKQKPTTVPPKAMSAGHLRRCEWALATGLHAELAATPDLGAARRAYALGSRTLSPDAVPCRLATLRLAALGGPASAPTSKSATP